MNNVQAFLSLYIQKKLQAYKNLTLNLTEKCTTLYIYVHNILYWPPCQPPKAGFPMQARKLWLLHERVSHTHSLGTPLPDSKNLLGHNLQNSGPQTDSWSTCWLTPIQVLVPWKGLPQTGLWYGCIIQTYICVYNAS